MPAEERVGQGEVGRVSTLGPSNMAASGLTYGMTLVGTGWAISPLLAQTGLENSLLAVQGPLFWQ